MYDLAPRHIISVGIAASANRQKLRLGDIVIADQVTDYEIQKIRGGKREIRSADYRCSPDLVRIANDLCNQQWFDSMNKEALKHSLRKSFKPRGLVANVACGDKIVASAKERDRLVKDLNRPNLFAIEMESAGICRALYETPDDNRPQFLMIKGICDYANNKKNDRLQQFAAEVAGGFLECFLHLFLQYNKERYPVSRGKIAVPSSYRPRVLLPPNPKALRMLEAYPKEISQVWRQTVIDGAIEILFCPTARNKYGGFGRDKISCEPDDHFEWPRDADLDNQRSRLSNLAKGLVGTKTAKGWLGDQKPGQRSEPNRIRILLNALVDPVLDRAELGLLFGNSDYFTVRTITEISRREDKGDLDGLKLSDIFPVRWAGRGEPFPKNCVPYHISAQGVLVDRDPNTGNLYLILTSANPQHSTLVYGWSATMAEQMWAPEPSSSFSPWWTDFTKDAHISIPSHKERKGDTHIQDTLTRGLEEEFGLRVGTHYPSDPKLLNVCLEQDMYFITFIFYVPLEMPLLALYDLWFNAPDRNEFGLLAAYPIGGIDGNGKEIDGPEAIANLLSKDTFDGTPYLIKNPTKESACGPWHITSRMRIYVAAHHLWGQKMAGYVGIQ